MADIWKIMWLFIVVLTTFVIISIYGPALGSAMNAALRQDAAYAASEIAGVISLVGAGPDGMQQIYSLPKFDRRDCIKIYRTYVVVELSGFAESGFVQGGAVPDITNFANANATEGDVPAAADWDALKISCSRREDKRLAIMRSGNSTKFRAIYASG